MAAQSIDTVREMASNMTDQEVEDYIMAQYRRSGCKSEVFDPYLKVLESGVANLQNAKQSLREAIMLLQLDPGSVIKRDLIRCHPLCLFYSICISEQSTEQERRKIWLGIWSMAS